MACPAVPGWWTYERFVPYYCLALRNDGALLNLNPGAPMQLQPATGELQTALCCGSRWRRMPDDIQWRPGPDIPAWPNGPWEPAHWHTDFHLGQRSAHVDYVHFRTQRFHCDEYRVCISQDEVGRGGFAGGCFFGSFSFYRNWPLVVLYGNYLIRLEKLLPKQSNADQREVWPQTLSIWESYREYSEEPD